MEAIRRRLTLTEKGKIKQSIGNVVTVLENDPFLAGAIRKNELTGRVDIVKNRNLHCICRREPFPGYFRSG